jgi:hypothetical protein
MYYIVVSGFGSSASGSFGLNYNYRCTNNCPSASPSISITSSPTPTQTIPSPSSTPSAGFCPQPVILGNSPPYGLAANQTTVGGQAVVVGSNMCGQGFTMGSTEQALFSFTVPNGVTSGTLYIDTCTGGTPWDSVITVTAGDRYAATCPSNNVLTCIAANDDAPSQCGSMYWFRSAVQVSLPVGTNTNAFMIAVAPRAGQTGGTFNLNYTFTPGVCSGGSPCPTYSQTPTHTPQSAAPTPSPVSATATPAPLSPASVPGLLVWLRPLDLSTATCISVNATTNITSFYWPNYLPDQRLAGRNQPGPSAIANPPSLVRGGFLGANSNLQVVKFTASSGGVDNGATIYSPVDLSAPGQAFTIMFVAALNDSAGSSARGNFFTQANQSQSFNTFALGWSDGTADVVAVS